ncbi:MAG: cupin domain-containing protein [Chthoniobacterales bacterium]
MRSDVGRKMNQNPWIQICRGIRRRTIITGPKMYQMRAELDGGSELPVHTHPQEQVAHVVSGRVRFIVDDKPVEVGPGESTYFTSNQPHGATTLETAVVIDTFSPPREDYLALDEKARAAQ